MVLKSYNPTTPSRRSLITVEGQACGMARQLSLLLREKIKMEVGITMGESLQEE